MYRPIILLQEKWEANKQLCLYIYARDPQVDSTGGEGPQCYYVKLQIISQAANDDEVLQTLLPNSLQWLGIWKDERGGSMVQPCSRVLFLVQSQSFLTFPSLQWRVMLATYGREKGAAEKDILARTRFCCTNQSETLDRQGIMVGETCTYWLSISIQKLLAVLKWERRYTSYLAPEVAKR